MIDLLIKLIYKLISLIDHIDYGENDEKLVESYDINNISIHTDTGWKPLSFVHLTKPFQMYNITLEGGYHLTCADTHIVFDRYMNEVFVKDLKSGDLVMTKEGPKKLLNLTTDNTNICMCDVTVNDENHRFYSNGILSHNTTTSAIFMLWYVLFNVDKNALVLGNKFKTAKEILDKIKNIFYYLPYYLKPGIRKWNEAEIVFDNGCRIMAEATTINSGISFTYHCVLADEFAHVAPNIVDKFYNQIFPTITAGKARFIISSTQNGFNLFYKLYKGAEDGENDYGPFKVDWPQVPEWNPNTMQWEKRDEVWHQKQAANLGGEEAFQKQFGTNFDVTGNTLISAKKIRKLQLEAEEFKPIDIPGLRHAENFKWKSEIEDVNQLRSMFLTFTIDLAEGVGQDSDIMNIHALKWDSHLERSYVETIGVCEIKDISVPDFAEIVVDFISRYCDMDNIILSFESNTFGGLFYKSITSYTDRHPELKWDAGIIARYERDMFSESKGIDAQKGKDKYSLGFRVTSATKKGACKLFKVFYEEGLIQNKYTRYLTQMENFSDVKGNGSYEASYGHDDIIMAEVQQAALMQTLKFKLLQELFEGELQRDNKISSEEFVDFYSDMYRDDSINFYEKAYDMNLSGGASLYDF